jgi:hypothetical protein
VAGVATLAVLAKLRKPLPGPVHPISVLFTKEQVRWLDQRRSAGLSRSAVIRLVIDQAMRREQESKA